MRIKANVKFPPGGWQFFEPTTGWRAPYPMVNDRHQTARAIAAHRKANPHRNLNPSESAALADLETYTCHRLKGDPNYCEDLSNTEKKTTGVTTAGPASNQGQRRALAKRVAGLAVGAETLAEWIGEGMEPVPYPQAYERASTCERCPLNQKGDWLNRLSAPIAQIVLRHLKAKSMLNLELPNEEQLGICAACECQLPLKVWVPIENIDMDADLESRLWNECWIRREKEAVGGLALP